MSIRLSNEQPGFRCSTLITQLSFGLFGLVHFLLFFKISLHQKAQALNSFASGLLCIQFGFQFSIFKGLLKEQISRSLIFMSSLDLFSFCWFAYSNFNTMGFVLFYTCIYLLSASHISNKYPFEIQFFISKMWLMIRENFKYNAITK